MFGFLRCFLISPLLKILFLCGFTLALLLGHPFHPRISSSPALAQSTSPAQLMQTGVDAYSQGDYTAAITVWHQALTAYPTSALADRALVNENLARAYQRIGDTVAAIAAWEAAATAYEQSDNSMQFGRMLTEQAQVYMSLGQHQRAAALLCGAEPEITTSGIQTGVICQGGALAIAEATRDAVGQAAVLGSLAETSRLQGEYDKTQAILAVALQLVEVSELPQYEAPMLNSLGNTHARLSRIAARRADAAELVKADIVPELQAEARENRDQAIAHFTRSIAAAQTQADLTTELRSHLSLLFLFQDLDGNTQVEDTRQRLGQLINQLPASRETAYAAITLAKSYQAHSNFDCEDYEETPQIATWLETGRRIAASIQDDRAASFALGELGHLEECRGHLNAAAQITNQAQLAASDALESADSLYLWEWQIGRIYRKQHQTEKALAAYAQAIATLDGIRTDILTADQELQFDFRDTVEPIYRQYIELQLDASSASAATKQQVVPTESDRIAEVLQTVDSLRLAELQNFFGNDCVLVSSEGARERLLKNETQTAVISSVVLSDRIVLIASFADGTSKTVWLDDSEELEQTAAEFRRGLKRFRDLGNYDKGLAQELYQKLIGEFQADFADRNINTLVFVQDGFLRNIPMAALHDGGQYLIQRYATATTPSLGLTAARAERPRELRALAVGISQETVTESGRRFNALSFVPSELAAVAEQLPGSKTLLDEEFTEAQLKVALEETRYPILHLATHGQFSTIPEETFVVTGSSDLEAAGELTFGQLEALIREASPNAEPIDLITLTACETATGDDRATLGLAGVAIRAGARSAIASLWNVDDETAAQLINDFYASLRDPSLSKAKALQAAQIAAIEGANENRNPGYWAPLILVGNWQ